MFSFGTQATPSHSENTMAFAVGKPAPHFKLEAVVDREFKTVGLDDLKGTWLLLLFYPLDFTFVCPTELCAFSDRIAEIRALDCDVCGVSVDSQFTHLAWTKQPRVDGGVRGITYPLLADLNREMSRSYGVLTEQGIALRGLFIIDPDGVVQHATVNNLSVGRSVDETIRVIQACQFVRANGEVCPADWRPGDDTIKPDANDALTYFARQHAAA
jgi:alkyl hydroperoxide reductase subunit AhpC